MIRAPTKPININAHCESDGRSRRIKAASTTANIGMANEIDITSTNGTTVRA
ncbi:hypothetical protein RvVAR031_pl00790 (plasmid) [Agrobacterium vitis]|nr:hypothetical protein RvVAR031_pl00790 [Agrobacterium vitis]